MIKITTAMTLCFMLYAQPMSTAMAMDQAGQERFTQFMDMNLQELARASAQKLKEKYPDEDWEKWDFPAYVFRDKIIETSYRVAVKEPEILGRANVSDEGEVIPCYCTCQKFGHQNLLYCFWKDGKIAGDFDEHGSQCAVCMRQAFLAFLWSQLGATHDEIMAGMKKKFAPLIKMKQEGKI